MIKNFEEVKKQLSELSEVVNKFKSEAVQLRIVELVFAGGVVPSEEPPEETSSDSGTPPSRRRRAKRKSQAANPQVSNGRGENKKQRASGKGPTPTLEKFIAEGFFNQKRTIGQIVEHCALKAQPFKNFELSGSLGRLVRDNKLTRTKNAESQYEYIVKK